MRNLLLKLISVLQEEAYYIGFIKKEHLTLSPNERYKRISWLQLNNYKKGWFADPFFLTKDNNQITLLAEEFVYEQNKGVISLLTIDYADNVYRLKNIQRILELPTHLSFPNIWREDGKIYVYPENHQSGALFLYELDLCQMRLVNPIKIIGEPLVDSALFKYNEKYFIIGTRRVHNTEDDMKTADIFVSDTLTGPYNYFQTINNENRVERGAGEIFKNEEGLIRPVQKCERRYGEAVILNKLLYDNKSFKEEKLTIIEPVSQMKYGRCLHTFNMCDDLCVIDGQEYLFPFIANIISRLYKKHNK